MSRRKGRYERRQMKRAYNKLQRNLAIGNIDNVFSYHNLYFAGKKCCNGVRWKNSVQRFEMHIFSGTAVRRRKILYDCWKPSPYVHFSICERGKVRIIDAPRIDDRQIEKVYTKEVLLPLYLPSMIWNNGASLAGKGLEFSKRELRDDLRYHYRRYGRAGYIILMDFHHFFPSASHEVIFNRHDKLIFDDDLKRVGNQIINTIHGDTGLPLGVEPSQVEMIAFPSALDNFIKCQLSLKCAGHYMDDYYIIIPPERNPKEILTQILEKAQELKLQINPSKTRIKPLTKTFKFCKGRYSLLESGKIIVRGNKDSAKRARKKIKAFHFKVKCGTMNYEDLWTSINGIMAYLNKYNSNSATLKLKRLFYSIFGFSSDDLLEFRRRDKEDATYAS